MMLNRWGAIWLAVLCLPAGLACTSGAGHTVSRSAVSPGSATTQTAGERVENGVTITPHPEKSIHTFSTEGWKTDFSRHTVPYREIGGGGPPKDGIAAIDRPLFATIVEASSYLKDDEPIVAVERHAEARAYPLQILLWHEIVNDSSDDEPFVVTYCPLCNTAIAFKRSFDGRTLDFGTTGNLRRSDLVMYDRQSESWWQQATGEGIAGTYAGRRLEFIPTSILSFGDFKSAYPMGRVLSRETGFTRDYGRNPYVAYDQLDADPLFSFGTLDKRLPPKERVVAVDLDGESVVYPFGALAKQRTVNDRVGGHLIVVFYKPGTKSALDAETTGASRSAGAGVVFDRWLDSRELTFQADGDHFLDDQTHSTWDITGRALTGALAGRRLQPIVHTNVFWFAWAAFRPDVRIFRNP
ncbi:MAG: DUF3179 domain-containing protein [Dehalococcoidia bacterium]